MTKYIRCDWIVVDLTRNSYWIFSNQIKLVFAAMFLVSTYCFCLTSAPVGQIWGFRNGGFLVHRSHYVAIMNKRSGTSKDAADMPVEAMMADVPRKSRPGAWPGRLVISGSWDNVVGGSHEVLCEGARVMTCGTLRDEDCSCLTCGYRPRTRRSHVWIPQFAWNLCDETVKDGMHSLR